MGWIGMVRMDRLKSNRRWLRVRRLDNALWGFLLLALALYLVGVSNDSESAHFISRILLFVPIVSFVLCLVNISGVFCNLRFGKARLHEGQSANLCLNITNYGSLSKINFILSANIRNETLGVEHHWRWLIPSIGGEQSSEVEIPIAGLKRGINRIEQVRLACVSPLSIFLLERGCENGEQCTVYPRLLCEPERIAMLNAHSVEAFLFHDPLDYRGVREYVPTDDPKLIHWMSTARRGELVVKIPERYGNAPCRLILHAPNGEATNEAWGSEPILEHMIRFAATFALAVGRAGHGINMLTGAWEVQVRGGKNEDAVLLLERLARLTYLEASLPVDVRHGVGIGFGLITALVTCDANDTINSLLQACGNLHAMHQCIIVCFCPHGDGCALSHHEVHCAKLMSVKGEREILPALERCVRLILSPCGVLSNV